jgi:beta-galactosidase GanA
MKFLTELKMNFKIIAFIFLFTMMTSFAQQQKTIMLGSVYNIFHEEYPTDEDFFKEVDRDIPLMKESNINYVMVFPMNQWNTETKQLLWKRTDYLIKKIENLDMKFVPLMLKEEQCSHYFPIWKFKEIPGMWEEYNLDNGNRNNRQDVDFADPRVYPLIDEYFKAVIGRYGKSPALGYYNIWNEPHYNSNANHVIKRYREWLKKKYGTLAKLRIAWGKEYTDWSQVSPFLNDNWNSSLPQIDWIMFKNELNGILLGELKQTLRKYDKVHLVNANPVGTPWANFSNYGLYNIDDIPVDKQNDINGISYYPDGWERGHNLEPMPFWLHNLTFNTIRSSSGKKDYILTELFTNTQNGLALNGYLTKSFVSLLAWTALSDNCKGLMYWKWLPFMRGRQSLGRGLCEVDGKLAPRGEAVKEFGAVLKKYGEVLYKAQLKKPQVAILVDMVGLLKTLEQTTEPATNKFMYESNAGLFKALYEKNISVDLVRMDQEIDLEKLKAYKIIFLPFQIVMRRDVADLLKTYVQQGGYVVADARTATINEMDFAYKISPGAGLDELFGATRPDWLGQKTFFKVKMNNDNLEFEGKYFKDKLELKNNVEVIGTFADSNEPAVIKNKYGNGTAILSAVPLGASYYDNPGNPVNKLILDFVKESGVTPDAQFVSPQNDFLDIKVHTYDDNYIVYVINSDSASKSGKIEMNVGNKKIKSIKNIITDEQISFEQKENIISIPLEMKEEQAAVFLVEE